MRLETETSVRLVSLRSVSTLSLMNNAEYNIKSHSFMGFDNRARARKGVMSYE